MTLKYGYMLIWTNKIRGVISSSIVPGSFTKSGLKTAEGYFTRGGLIVRAPDTLLFSWCSQHFIPYPNMDGQYFNVRMPGTGPITNQ